MNKKTPKFPHGKALRDAREHRLLSQVEHARIADVDQQQISEYETGKRIPCIGQLLKVLSAAGCSVVIRNRFTGNEYQMVPEDYPVKAPRARGSDSAQAYCRTMRKNQGGDK